VITRIIKAVSIGGFVRYGLHLQAQSAEDGIHGKKEHHEICILAGDQGVHGGIAL